MRLEYPLLFDYVKTFKAFNPSLEPVFKYMCGDTSFVERRLEEFDNLITEVLSGREE